MIVKRTTSTTIMTMIKKRMTMERKCVLIRRVILYLFIFTVIFFRIYSRQPSKLLQPSTTTTRTMGTTTVASTVASTATVGATTTVETTNILSNNDDDDNNNNNPFSKIILMGQFNYDDFDLSIFKRWLSKVETIGFAKVAIRGEFWNQTRLDEIRQVLMKFVVDKDGPDPDPDPDTSGGADIIRPPPQSTWPFGKRISQRGFFSPLGNLANVLMENNNEQNDGDYDGVMYVHDDSIFNVELLATRYLKTKLQRTTTIIGTDLGRPTERTVSATNNVRLDRSYEDPMTRRHGNDADDGGTETETEDQWKYAMKRRSYRIYPQNTSFPWTDIDGYHPTSNYQKLHSKVLDDWPMRKRRDGRCMKNQYKLALDDKLAGPYYEYDDDHDDNDSSGKKQSPPYIVFPSYTQADFLYVPMKFAKPFYKLADLHNKHKIWIECSMSSVVYQLRRMYNASVDVVPLCTSWDLELRGKTSLVYDCINNQKVHSSSGTRNFHGFYHPIKPSMNITEYERVFDLINGPWIDEQNKKS
mmetsp:Transcript_34254/g.82484  ORF Transcript_34254/g.82484 Transcript_34254/m.82484 type:complete len:527 (+) Transcript_34254:217-1797(+)